MADRIVISTEEMAQAVSAYTAAKEIKMDAIAAMKNAVEVMDSSFDGPAAEVFMAAFEALYGKIMTTEEKMTDAINELNNLIAATEAADADVSNLGTGAEAMAGSL